MDVVNFLLLLLLLLWKRTWWSQVLDFMHTVDCMAEGRLHPDILSDNIHDPLGNTGTGLLDFDGSMLVWA